jgi:hypothetical protein
MTALQIVLSVLVAVLVVWLVVLILRDATPDDWLYGALGVLELGMVVELVIGMVRVFGDHGHLNVAAYAGYLVGSILLLPVAFAWSIGERTRAGTGVLLVAVLVVPVLFLRIDQLWGAR